MAVTRSDIMRVVHGVRRKRSFPEITAASIDAAVHFKVARSMLQEIDQLSGVVLHDFLFVCDCDSKDVPWEICRINREAIELIDRFDAAETMTDSYKLVKPQRPLLCWATTVNRDYLFVSLVTSRVLACDAKMWRWRITPFSVWEFVYNMAAGEVELDIFPDDLYLSSPSG